MTPPPPIQIRVERRIAASAARIYDAWLDPSLAARFLFATPNGRMRSVDIDARVGGSFRIVETRNANVNAFYQTTSIGIAWDMIQYYKVSYVILGGLERVYYNAEGLAKFDNMVQQGLLEVVFQQGNSTIYRVNPDAKLLEQG
jgi:hypothetical protein